MKMKVTNTSAGNIPLGPKKDDVLGPGKSRDVENFDMKNPIHAAWIKEKVITVAPVSATAVKTPVTSGSGTSTAFKG